MSTSSENLPIIPQVIVQFSADLVERMDALIKQGHYKNRSDLIRQALDEYLEKRREI